MNLKAKCVNAKCGHYGIEKSVTTGQMLGYGAPNDRVKCPGCGELMRTAESINTTSKGRGKSYRGPKRSPKRSSKRY